jgi:hypothetical protein
MIDFLKMGNWHKKISFRNCAPKYRKIIAGRRWRTIVGNEIFHQAFVVGACSELESTHTSGFFRKVRE